MSTSSMLSISAGSIMADPFVAKRAHIVRSLRQRVREDIVKIGQDLTEVRDHIGHGVWLEDEFAWSDQTARRFIHVYELSKDSKFNNLLNLNLPLATLYQLAAPKTPEAARQEVAQRIEAGERPNGAMLTEAIAKAKGETTHSTDAAENGPVIFRNRKTGEAYVEGDVTQHDDGGGRDDDDHVARVSGNDQNDDDDRWHHIDGAASAAPTIKNAPTNISAKSKTKPSLLEFWEATPEDRAIIRDLALEEYFKATSSADLRDRMRAAHPDLVSHFFDALGVDGMLEAMSPEFGQTLRACVPARQ